MPGAPAPQVLLEAIAADAGPTFITSPMPEAPTGTLAASIQGGFPPIVMTNENAGGKPPLGQDQNGFLFLISSHTLWVECGQLYLYNAALATAIGGYLVGTVLGMSDGSGMWLNRLDGNTSNPDTGGTGWAPLTCYGRAAITGLTGGTVTLTAVQSKFGVIVLTGILTSNLTINFPNLTIQEWLVINGTSGAFTTTLKTALGGSTGVICPQGGFSAPLGVYSVGDGNIYPTVAPLSVPIDQNATPLTIAERTNNGDLIARYFYENAALENPAIGGVMVVNNTDLNFLRKISLTNFEVQLLLQGMGGQLVNGQVPYSVVQQWVSTFLNNATLTGVSIYPVTVPQGSNGGQLVNAAFVNPGSTIATTGSRTRSDGFIEKWGTLHIGDVIAPTGGTVTFAAAFPAACFGVEITGSDANSTGATFVTAAGPYTQNNFVWFASELTSAVQNVALMWRAIGN